MNSVNPIYKSMSALIAALLLASACSATDTRVAVLEFGKGGVVRRTQSNPVYTSVKAVQSFWSVLHDGVHMRESKQDRVAMQHPDMSMVPDMFNRANGGLIIGVTGDVDFGKTDPLKSIMAESSIGDFILSGSHAEELFKNHISNSDDSALQASVEKVMGEAGNRVEKLSFHGTAEVNNLLSVVLLKIKEDAEAKGTTVIVQLVMDVDELDVASNSDNMDMQRRRLDEVEGDENSIFSGYSYKLYNGDTYTPWKTIYQIQTFNLYLWTAVGLFCVLFTALFKFATLRLIPDTLLFGEAGKAMGD